MQSDLRKKLIDAFTLSGGDFLSGQRLAEIAGCSRTAVWKHMEDLRKDGFIIEAVRKKGYRILEVPEKVSGDEISLGLKTDFLGRQIHYEESVESTQKIAHRLAADGAPEGTIIVADEQTMGRGRLGRRWHSPKFSGIWLSVILRPDLPPPKAPQLTLIAAVAVVQAIEDVTGLVPQIKWPNDILIGQKKVTGILTELQAESDRINAIIIGIGMNVNQKAADFPEEIIETATSLAIEAGHDVSRAALIQSMLYRLEKLYKTYLDKGFYPIKLLWESYAISIGKKITARTLSGDFSGTALGITEDGVLMIEESDGSLRYVYSADIQLDE
ncbi:biotin--[acetyl-CoA-carboxylase] ligase [Mesobacillus zeae]|uniref:Bifunctional ligase/repressor BirA n=1 Tax=Mesobacillus zeae TaxID=1917180 RepID=A0A398AY59_9BACI|nr:biotin--[acetyl-CoA-carboxylase] ligase [Mesobacillus zeae]RID82557.1 biotin--[acetyl-CoA-carboxylase] ligase [Mesobacillus zeae]